MQFILAMGKNCDKIAQVLRSEKVDFTRFSDRVSLFRVKSFREER